MNLFKNITRLLSSSIVFGLIAGIIMNLFSCTPSQQIAQLQKRHPEMFKSDTVRTLHTVTVPGGTVAGMAALHFDTTGIAELLAKYQNYIAPDQYLKLQSQINSWTKNQKVIPDSIIFTDKGSGIVLKIWQQDGKIRAYAIKPPSPISYHTDVVNHYTTVVTRDLPWWFWPVVSFASVFGIIGLIAIIQFFRGRK